MKAQDAELPVASIAVHTTFVCPNCNMEPDEGLQVTTGAGSRLSSAIGLDQDTGFVAVRMLAGHIKVGASWSEKKNRGIPY